MIELNKIYQFINQPCDGLPVAFPIENSWSQTNQNGLAAIALMFAKKVQLMFEKEIADSIPSILIKCWENLNEIHYTFCHVSKLPYENLIEPSFTNPIDGHERWL